MRSSLFAIGFVLALALGCSSDTNIDSEMERVRELARQGEFEELVPLLTDLHYAHPDDPEINHLYGVALLRTDNSGMAIWPLRKAAESPGREVVDGLLLARALSRGAVPIDALVVIDRILEIKPERLDIWSLRAQVNQSLKHYDDALKDCDRMLELDSDRADAVLCRAQSLSSLDRFDEAESAVRSGMARLETSARAKPKVKARFCRIYAELAESREEMEVATKRWERCVGDFPVLPDLIAKSVRFFDQQGRAERATEILEAAVEAAPKDFEMIEALAGRYDEMGRSQESEDLLRAATARKGISRRAWITLAEHHRQRDEFEEAIAATEAGFEGRDSMPTLLLGQYADDMIQAGRFDQADEIIKLLPDHPGVFFLRGRGLLLRGFPVRALEEIDKGLSLWPGNATARLLAGQAAEQIGDIDRAISEYRDALRAGPGLTDAALRLARLLEAEGNLNAALVALAHRSRDLPKDLDTRVALLRVARKLGREDVIAEQLQAVSELPEAEVTFVLETAAAVQAYRGPTAAAESILSSKLDLDDPENAEALGVLTWYLAQSGRAQMGLDRIKSVVESHSDAAALYEILGTALTLAGHPDADAMDAFERSIELDATRASALGALAHMHAKVGQNEEAVAMYDRARMLSPGESGMAWFAIERVASTPGLRTEKELDERLTELLRLDPIHVGATTLKAERLLEGGEYLAQAEKLILRSIRFGGGPRAFILRGRIAAASGEPRIAAGAFSRVEKLETVPASILYELALAYEEFGALDEARAIVRRVLSSADFPGIEDARSTLARLEANADG